jgi:hypothetical protein
MEGSDGLASRMWGQWSAGISSALNQEHQRKGQNQNRYYPYVPGSVVSRSGLIHSVAYSI